MDNMLSGLIGAVIGALIGAIAVAFASHADRVYSAKSRLRALLLHNGYSIYWGNNGKEPWQVIEANRTEVHAEYLALRSLLLFRPRIRLSKAWKTYVNVEHYDNLLEDEPARIFAKSAVSREQALHITISLLKASE